MMEELQRTLGRIEAKLDTHEKLLEEIKGDLAENGARWQEVAMARARDKGYVLGASAVVALLFSYVGGSIKGWLGQH